MLEYTVWILATAQILQPQRAELQVERYVTNRYRPCHQVENLELVYQTDIREREHQVVRAYQTTLSLPVHCRDEP